MLVQVQVERRDAKLHLELGVGCLEGFHILVVVSKDVLEEALIVC